MLKQAFNGKKLARNVSEFFVCVCFCLFGCVCVCVFANVTAFNTWLVKSTPEYQNINYILWSFTKSILYFDIFFFFCFGRGVGSVLYWPLSEAVKYEKITCACSFK